MGRFKEPILVVIVAQINVYTTPVHSQPFSSGQIAQVHQIALVIGGRSGSIALSALVLHTVSTLFSTPSPSIHLPIHPSIHPSMLAEGL